MHNINEESGHEFRKKKILKYVMSNPGVSKEGVVRGMKGDPSRLTVLKMLAELKDEDMIVLRTDKPNSQIYRIYPNETNLLVSVETELDEFERAYISFLQKANKRIVAKLSSDHLDKIDKKLRIKQYSHSKWGQSDVKIYSNFVYEMFDGLSKRIEKIYDILEKRFEIARQDHRREKIDTTTITHKAELLYFPITSHYANDLIKIKKQIESMRLTFEANAHYVELSFLPFAAMWIYNSMMNIYLYRSTFIWPKKIQDEKTLKQLLAIVYTRMPSIMLHLSNFFRFFRDTDQEVSIHHISNLSQAKRVHEVLFRSPIYVVLDMKKEIELVANCLFKISEELGKYNYYTLEFRQCRTLLRNLEMYDKFLQLNPTYHK